MHARGYEFQCSLSIDSGFRQDKKVFSASTVKFGGLAETISTFRVAADFCEKYDGFVFNHNEALLYEWVEEYEPQLFERIKKLVKEKKWTIMGGWYLQPDCVMTSG